MQRCCGLQVLLFRYPWKLNAKIAIPTKIVSHITSVKIITIWFYLVILLSQSHSIIETSSRMLQTLWLMFLIGSVLIDSSRHNFSTPPIQSITRGLWCVQGLLFQSLCSISIFLTQLIIKKQKTIKANTWCVVFLPNILTKSLWSWVNYYICISSWR